MTTSALSMTVPNAAKNSRETVSERMVMTKRFFCLRALRCASLPIQPNSSPLIEKRLIFLTVLARDVIASTGVF